MIYSILCIKSSYANKIKKGKKKWEFRKFKVKNFHHMYLYEPRPIKKITLDLSISNYIVGSPKEIWKLCKKDAGMSKKEFFEYCNNKKIYAYQIQNFNEVNIDINNYNVDPPRCVIYIEEKNH